MPGAPTDRYHALRQRLAIAGEQLGTNQCREYGEGLREELRIGARMMMAGGRAVKADVIPI